MPATAHTLAVLAGALLAVFGGKEATLSGGGALAAIVLGATAARLWPAEACKPVRAHVNEAWGHLQPALFGLLGAAVDVSTIDASQLGSGLGLLGAALTVRICVTRLALVRSGLNAKEAGLVCIAWLPKATVQVTAPRPPSDRHPIAICLPSACAPSCRRRWAARRST